MDSFTHHGFGTDPGRYTAPEPIFLLLRQRPYVRPSQGDGAFELRTQLPPTWPFANELDSEDVFAPDDDLEERWILRHGTSRGVFVRIVGFVTLTAALVGCGALLARPDARREVLGWATLGHAQVVLDAASRAASAARGLGHTE